MTTQAPSQSSLAARNRNLSPSIAIPWGTPVRRSISGLSERTSAPTSLSEATTVRCMKAISMTRTSRESSVVPAICGVPAHQACPRLLASCLRTITSVHQETAALTLASTHPTHSIPGSYRRAAA